MTVAAQAREANGDDAPIERRWRGSLALLWLGQIVSHVGDAFFLGVVFFLALDVTQSRAASGLLMALNFTPALALGLFAGAIVDRHDRRRVMIAADLLRAVAVASIPVLAAAGHLNAAGLGFAIFALALGTTSFNPAMKALIPEIAPPRHLTAAAAMFQIADYASLVVGPLIAALLVPKLGAMNLLWLDAGTFVFSAGCLALLPKGTRAVARAWAPARVLVAEVVAGVRSVLADPLLRLLLMLAVLDNVLTMGLLHVAAPLYVRDELRLGTDAYLRAQTFFFLGMTVASAAFWALGRRWPKGPMIIAGLLLDGLTLVPVAFCRTRGQLELVLFIHACAIPLMIIPRTVLIQQRVPGALHGRTFALLNVTVFGMMAISSGITGVLADLVSVRALFIVLGTAGLLPGLLALASHKLRSER